MAIIHVYKNQITSEFETLQVEEGKKVSDIKDLLNLPKIEVYNQKTQKTTYKKQGLEDCSIFVNGIEQDESYEIKESDIISVYPRQYNEDVTGGALAILTGIGAVVLGLFTGGVGFLAFGIVGAVFILGGAFQMTRGLEELKGTTKTIKDGDESEALLSLRGGKNQSIIGQRFPVVIGKHLITPFIVGAPYQEISSKDGIGDIIYQKQLLVLGYSPLKVTDVKFEENIVCYNKTTNINGIEEKRDTLFHGKLIGSDILPKWENNDISLEILQDFNSTSINDIYGTIYPAVVKSKEADANIFHIYDKDLESHAQVIYKNTSFKGGFRTNTVKFSDSCPYKIEVELDFTSGLFATNNYSDDSVSEPRYYNIPCNIAVQWRYVNKKDQPSSSAEDPSGWISFTQCTDASLVEYTKEMASDDISRNGGLTPGTSSDYNQKWIGAKCFTFGNYDNTSYKKGTVNINERRYVASYEFSAEEARKLCDNENYLDVVEVRVVRLTPAYIDETKSVSSDSKWSNKSYQDLCKWTMLRTFCFDKEEFEKNNTQNPSEFPLRPLSISDMRKFCLLAVSVKPDKVGSIANALESINVIATSLSPNYVEEKWVPEVSKSFDYYINEKDSTGNIVTTSITKEEYLTKINNGEEAFKAKKGNDFVEKIKSEIFVAENKNDKGYILPTTIENKYVSSNPASGLMLTMLGGHLGVDAKDYTDFDMNSVSKLYKFCEDVVDGRPDEKSPDGLKHIPYHCDGILSSEQKLSTVLTQILITGRSVLSYDNKGCFRVIVDEPKKYPELVLSQQNCISSSNSKNLDDSISGFNMTFIDEDDGYDTNTLGVMADGEDYKNPKKEVTDYNIPFITNRDHLWSLGRYVLANNLLQREIYTRVVGKIGRLLKYGSYVLLRDETISVGTDKGGRIQYLIEDESQIYGFVIDEVYEYTGELDGERCKKGLVLVQPQEFGYSRCVTLRMCTPEGVVTKDGSVLIPTIGQTNIVILEDPIQKSDDGEDMFIDGQWVKVCPKEGNIVEFGNVGEITKGAMVTSIKPSDKGTFTISLCAYNDTLYNYGKELPVIQNKKQIIESNVEDIQLTEYVKKTDIQEEISGNINSALSQLADKKDPEKPVVTNVIPEKTGIRLIASIPDKKQNAVQFVKWEVDKGEGYVPLVDTSELSGFYYFNNEYLEDSVLATWKFRARVFNVYSRYSEYSDEAYADLTHYGTWKLSKPLIFTQVIDRTAVLSFVMSSRSDNKEVYGNIRYKLVIQRFGNSDIADTEDYVEPDTAWYKPATQASAYESEDNYKQGEAVEAVDGLEVYSSFSQTLPLVGQTNKNSVATEYRYKVVAFNEAGYSVESEVVSVTALPTNLADIVHSNEDYKDLYVQRLSAISANIGLISQGGFGSFKKAENYWALSDLSAEDTGIEGGVKKGAFRVGGKSQYILVEPISKDGVEDYNVSVKAGNLKFESDKTDVDGSLIAYDNYDPTKETRIRLTSKGLEFQKAISFDETGVANAYKSCGFVRQSPSGSLMVTNTEIDDVTLPQERITLDKNTAVYHFDADLKDTHGGNAADLMFDGMRLIVADESPLSSAVYRGTIYAPVKNKSCAFFTKSNRLYLGNQFIINTDGTVIDARDFDNALGIETGIFKIQR